MTLTKQFLRAKHWQLFLLTFGIPIVAEIFLMGTIFTSVFRSQHPDPTIMLRYFAYFPLLVILFTGILFGWQWSVAMGLQNKIPAGVKMKTTQFKIFFFISVVYLLLFMAGMSVLMSSLGTAAESGGPTEFPLIVAGSMAIIFPVHLFVMFCLFYLLYFIAKTIKTIELQRETTFSDFAGEFFLIWFFPIGVWIIQPRINKMMGDGQAN